MNDDCFDPYGEECVDCRPMPEQVRAEMRAELIEQVAAHEGLQDRIVRMFAESFLTDARLEQVVACWPGVAPVEDVTA